MQPRLIFLLGGSDLEMLTIMHILDECMISYVNRHLCWNDAVLSHYEEEIALYGGDMQYIIYGVELQEDIPVPSNYIRIDHHNDFNDKPSSLEQVAAILHYTLNRYQCLVAINDAAYITGLMRGGATSEEIEKIRREDRKAQGVTDIEETLAEKAINEQKKVYGTCIVVRAYSSSFSPICDRLYPYRHLLIYTDDELMYYGSNVKLLVRHYCDASQSKSFFYGGGTNGYFGCAKGVFTPEEIKQMVEQIKCMCHDI